MVLNYSVAKRSNLLHYEDEDSSFNYYEDAHNFKTEPEEFDNNMTNGHNDEDFENVVPMEVDITNAIVTGMKQARQ